MSEHGHNPVVLYLKDNPGVKISSQEVSAMRRKAHRKALEAYFEKNPRRTGRLLDGGWIIRGMRKEHDKGVYRGILYA